MNILYFHPDTQISKDVFMFLTGCPVLPGRTLKYASSPRAGWVLSARAAGVSGYVYSNADECRLPRDGGKLQCLWSLPAGPWAESDAVLQVNPCSPWVCLPSARRAKAPAGCPWLGAVQRWTASDPGERSPLHPADKSCDLLEQTGRSFNRLLSLLKPRLSLASVICPVRHHQLKQWSVWV